MAMATRGSLHVTLVSATLLPSSSPQGDGSGADHADSYATVSCGKQQFTTRTAKDQGTLPTWNQTHAFELEDHDEFGSQDLVIEIFAARPELNELLGVAKLSLCKIIPANEETSLYPLSRRDEGECGQVKVTLKWESHMATTTVQSAPICGGYQQIQPTPRMYPPGPTQPSAPVHPNKDPIESYYGEQRYGEDTTPADAAASALAGLALNQDKQHSNDSIENRHQDASLSASNFAHQRAEVQSSYAAYRPSPQKRGSNPHQPPDIDTYFVNDSGSYPPYSSEAPGHYPSHGLPYLASPIGGVVITAPDYNSPTPAYTHPPFEITSNLKDSESIAQPYGLPATAYPESNHQYSPSPSRYSPNGDLLADMDKERVSQVPFEPPVYPGAPVSQPESYSSTFQPHVTNTERHSYHGFTQYGGSSSAPSETYPPPGGDFSSKAQNTANQGTGAPGHYGVTQYPGSYTPESRVGYPPNSSFPSSGQYEHNTPPSAGYLGQQNAEQGKDKADLGITASSQVTSKGETHEKGFHGYQYGYPPEGYAQPYYPPAAYPQYGYPPQNLAHGYPPQGYPAQYAPQHIAPGFGGLYPQHGHQVAYEVAPAYHGHQQEHGHYHHQGGHVGHHGGHKFEGHNGGHGYWPYSYGGHKSGHGYQGSHGHSGYGYRHHES